MVCHVFGIIVHRRGRNRVGNGSRTEWFAGGNLVLLDHRRRKGELTPNRDGEDEQPVVLVEDQAPAVSVPGVVRHIYIYDFTPCRSVDVAFFA